MRGIQSLILRGVRLALALAGEAYEACERVITYLTFFYQGNKKPS